MMDDRPADSLPAAEAGLLEALDSPPARDWRRRGRDLAPAGAAFVLVMVIWEAGIRVFDVQAFVLPAPSVIISRFVDTAPVVWGAGWNTFVEAIVGLIGGTALGVLAAFATVRWVLVREGLMPLAIAANSIPIIALAPIANGMFSLTSPVPKMVVVAVVVFFPVLVNTARGLIEVEADELELMHSYAAAPAEVMWQVRVPHSLPYFFSAMKVVSVLSIVFAIVAEYFGGSQAVLGQYILTKANLFVYPDAWAGILVASILGVALYTIVVGVERVVMPWSRSSRNSEPL
jgi:NitT/TauT family transport system permease protein